jgi:hypothetical protein
MCHNGLTIFFKDEIYVTQCSTDLEQGMDIIIFECILTTFEASFIFFEATGAVAKIGSSLKLDHQK